jgi:hypothetical protein
MKATELRIGNKITDGFFEYTLTKIGEDIVEGYIEENDNVYYGLKFENVEPIKLTEQWLEDFGPLEIDGYPINYAIYDNHLYEGDGKVNANCQMISRIPIPYVHQLQNLYFALTGKELTK